jgi:hypothetical protein
VDIILDAWKKIYGKERVKIWIDTFEKSGGKSIRDFDQEEVLKE